LRGSHNFVDQSHGLVNGGCTHLDGYVVSQTGEVI
jgi:hypothetical protein